ncbi:esterase E4-like [Planococcus citri]|uniref:esterase E4-like n=1 Tax=Planococcus citri TaxID=170843 RepID=UPI0031F773C0
MSEKIIVSVCEGKIQGFKNVSTFSGVEFFSFLGVPYGQSTAGHARYKDPKPVKPWKNILMATTEKGGCLQFSLRKALIDGSEDCLYNNIHTPELPQKDDDPLRPVVVCLQPGAYHTGSPDPSYFGSPDYVMHNDVVCVCVSFRLHILGFLNLDLPECSGNQGLKDIILSLQWIQRNICKFGGDPDNVTLLGSSSGAGLVNNLMISPKAKGLFHKGVIMGMYKYCPSLVVRSENATLAFELAQNLGYNGPFDKKKLLSFYKKVNIRALLVTRPDRFFHRDETAPLFPMFPFVTTVDSGENAVLPTSNKQENLKSLTRIPLMVGFCEREAIFGFLRPYKKASMKYFFKSIRQNCWGWGAKLNDDQLKYIQNKIQSFYLKGNSIENAPLPIKCDIQSDIAASDLYPTLVDVVAADLPSSVYVYKFEFQGNVPKMKDVFQFVFDEPLDGTYHGDDFTYWAKFSFPYDQIEDPLTPETEEMVKTFTKLVSTFAKTGDPNYEGITTQWKPTTVENPSYFSINNHLSMVEGKLNGNRTEFWEELRRELENDNQTCAEGNNPQ